jgi:hypothetical protein
MLTSHNQCPLAIREKCLVQFRAHTASLNNVRTNQNAVSTEGRECIANHCTMYCTVRVRITSIIHPLLICNSAQLFCHCCPLKKKISFLFSPFYHISPYIAIMRPELICTPFGPTPTFLPPHPTRCCSWSYVELDLVY